MMDYFLDYDEYHNFYILILESLGSLFALRLDLEAKDEFWQEIMLNDT